MVDRKTQKQSKSITGLFVCNYSTVPFFIVFVLLQHQLILIFGIHSNFQLLIVCILKIKNEHLTAKIYWL